MMNRVRQPQVWILVADGGHARIVVPEAAEGRFRTLLPLGAAEHPHYPPPLREDPRRLDKPRFVTDVAERLNWEAARGAYDQLVLVAPGHVLHAVRESLSRQAAGRVVGTVAKDYSELSNDELCRLLGAWWLAPPAVAA